MHYLNCDFVSDALKGRLLLFRLFAVYFLSIYFSECNVLKKVHTFVVVKSKKQSSSLCFLSIFNHILANPKIISNCHFKSIRWLRANLFSKILSFATQLVQASQQLTVQTKVVPSYLSPLSTQCSPVWKALCGKTGSLNLDLFKVWTINEEHFWQYSSMLISHTVS